MAAICGAFEERACHAMFDGAPDLIAALDDECRRVYEALAAETAR
jgi:hypothetical protein